MRWKDGIFHVNFHPVATLIASWLLLDRCICRHTTHLICLHCELSLNVLIDCMMYGCERYLERKKWRLIEIFGCFKRRMITYHIEFANHWWHILIIVIRITVRRHLLIEFIILNGWTKWKTKKNQLFASGNCYNTQIEFKQWDTQHQAVQSVETQTRCIFKNCIIVFDYMWEWYTRTGVNHLKKKMNVTNGISGRICQSVRIRNKMKNETKFASWKYIEIKWNEKKKKKWTDQN